MMRRVLMVVLAAWAMALPGAQAQSSSLLRTPPARSEHSVAARSGQGLGPPAAAPGPVFDAAPPRDRTRPMARTLERVSFIALPSMPPRKFKVHDLLTIIVRQHKRYESKAKMDTERKWAIDGELSNWWRFYDDWRHLGKDRLSNGRPGFKFDLDNKYETDGQNNRKDVFETRIGARIVDVKPNGNLVIEATMSETHDEEVLTITMTGVCRAEDVTAENTILSTQLSDLVLVEKNSGAVRDATTRGWIPRILDFVRPF